MADIMSREMAAQEITKWLDYKKVKETQRETNKAQVDTLVDAMQCGSLIMDNSSFSLTQKLDVPDTINALIGGDTLTFKARISIGELQRASTNVKATDFDGKITSYIAALTGKAFSHIQKMDSEDYKIGQAIAVFFM